MNYIKQNHLSLLIIAFLVLSSLFGGSPTFGALDRTTVGNPWTFSGAVTHSGTLKVGSSGTAQTNYISTTCAPKADNSIAATSTGYMYCTGVTGVTSADFVVAEFATSTAAFTLTKDNFWIISAQASTTAGAVDFLVYNGTGAAAVPSAVGRAASTTVVRAGH